MVTDLTRPIVGIENRTAQEVFDIMCDRLKAEFGTEEAPRYTTRRLREETRKAEERGRQYEREAALSTDAEPVKPYGYIVELRTTRVHHQNAIARSRVQPYLQVANACVEHWKTIYAEECWYCEIVPLYAAPPAPSVAVKALDWEAHDDGINHIAIGAFGMDVAYVATSEGWRRFSEKWVALDGLDASKAAAQADYAARIRSALSAQVQDVATPEGWQLIPKEPTREMWAAMANTLYGYKNRHHDKVAGDLFQAMLAAAPAAKLEEKP